MTAIALRTDSHPETPSALAWIEVCTMRELPAERSVAALVLGEQLALIRTHDDAVYAVQQRDPYSGAMVLSRGLVGTRGERAILVSPMYKQVFALDTGECLDALGKEPISLRTWPVRLADGRVSVGLTADEAA